MLPPVGNEPGTSLFCLISVALTYISLFCQRCTIKEYYNAKLQTVLQNYTVPLKTDLIGQFALIAIVFSLLFTDAGVLKLTRRTISKNFIFVILGRLHQLKKTIRVCIERIMKCQNICKKFPNVDHHHNIKIFG